MIAPTFRLRWMAILDVAILAAAAVVGVFATRATDRDYVRLNPPDGPQRAHSVSRPEWVWRIQYPYGRFRHDSLIVTAMLTLGAAGVLASDPRTWKRRGPLRPGAVAVGVALAIGVLAAASAAIGAPAFVSPPSFWYNYTNLIEYRASGAVLAAWATLALGGLWRPCSDWRDAFGRVVGWCWIGSILSMLLFPLLFG